MIYKPEKENNENDENLQYKIVGANFNKPTKEEEDLAKTKNKINQFLILWFRYIISHYIYTLVKYQYENS